MAIDYKKALETAARTMILVHNPDTLIKMVVRMIVQKVQVSHASILLHQKDKDSYILTVSRGQTGLKIPKGFTRMDPDNPLIRYFKERHDKRIFKNEIIIYEEGQNLLNNITDAGQQKLLSEALYQMDIFETDTCIPSYFRNDLLGILLLGKKNDGAKFNQEELDFFAALAQDVSMAIRNAQLFNELEQELEKKQRLFFHTTIALTAAIDAKDHYTHGHTTRVTNVSLEIAKKLAENDKKILEGRFLESLHIASLLHDIGKIGIPEAILNKEGPLNEEEWKRIKEHPLIGVTILQPIHELSEAVVGVKYHHERYDGKGYPEGLKGEQIPLIASIIAVADAFDAMMSDRPYRPRLSREAALQEIKKESGVQFNPQVAAVFVELFQQGKF